MLWVFICDLCCSKSPYLWINNKVSVEWCVFYFVLIFFWRWWGWGGDIQARTTTGCILHKKRKKTHCHVYCSVPFSFFPAWMHSFCWLIGRSLKGEGPPNHLPISKSGKTNMTGMLHLNISALAISIGCSHQHQRNWSSVYAKYWHV